MDRQERLKLCEKCQLRKMDMKKGLLCSLTMEYADFEESCPSYKVDTVREKDVNEHKGKPSRLIIEEIPEKPKKYWNRLGYFLLASIAIFFVLSVIKIDFFRNEPNKFFLYFYTLLHTFPVWVFIGWETNKLKNGVIAGIIIFVLYSLRLEFNSLNNIFITYFIILLPVIYFGFTSLTNKRKRGKFILFSFIAIIGVQSFMFYDVLHTTEDFFSLIDLVFDSNSYPSIGLFNIQSEIIERRYIVTSLENDFYFSFSQIMVFIVITFAYKYLNGNLKWKMNLITLGRKETTNKMILYVFVFYTTIGFVAFGLLGQMIVFFNRLKGESRMYSNSPALGYDDYFGVTISFFTSFLLLIFIVGLYRKILVEYYLERGKFIGWNFYFGQMPFIGIFVWVYNYFTLKKKTININKIKIRELSTRQDGLVFLLTFFSIAYFFIMVSLPIHVNNLYVVFLLLGTILYIVYLQNKVGIYLVAIFKITTLLGFIYLEIIDEKIPGGSFFGGVFWSLSFYFLVYPVFFLRTFKIQIPKNSSEEE